MNSLFGNFIDNVKAFFKRSWSIFLARLEIFTGFIIGVISAIDWSGFANIDLGAGFSTQQAAWFAAGLIIKGIVSEIGRRSGTVETTKAILIPKSVVDKTVEIKQ